MLRAGVTIGSGAMGCVFSPTVPYGPYGRRTDEVTKVMDFDEAFTESSHSQFLRSIDREGQYFMLYTTPEPFGPLPWPLLASEDPNLGRRSGACANLYRKIQLGIQQFGLNMPRYDTDLQGLIGRAQTVSYESVIEALVGLCQGLKKLHERNFVHSDLKPMNIAVTGLHGPSDRTTQARGVRFSVSEAQPGSQLRFKLTDYGWMRPIADAVTQLVRMTYEGNRYYAYEAKVWTTDLFTRGPELLDRSRRTRDYTAIENLVFFNDCFGLYQCLNAVLLTAHGFNWPGNWHVSKPLPKPVFTEDFDSVAYMNRVMKYLRLMHLYDMPVDAAARMADKAALEFLQRNGYFSTAMAPARSAVRALVDERPGPVSRSVVQGLPPRRRTSERTSGPKRPTSSRPTQARRTSSREKRPSSSSRRGRPRAWGMPRDTTRPQMVFSQSRAEAGRALLARMQQANDLLQSEGRRLGRLN